MKCLAVTTPYYKPEPPPIPQNTVHTALHVHNHNTLAHIFLISALHHPYIS